MKKNILIILTLIVALIAFANLAKAQTTKSYPAGNDSNSSPQKELFTADSNRNKLLGILTDVQNDLENKDIPAVQARSNDISSYLKDRRNNSGKIAKQDEKVEKLLELEYGGFGESRSVIISLVNQDKVLKVSSLKDRIDLYHFSANQVNKAKIRYVTYHDKDDKKVNNDLNNFLTAVTAGDELKIRKEIKNIYDNIFKDSDNKITSISKIRDNLTLARYLASNGQPRAAEDNIKWTDSLILKLIELTSTNPAEQKTVKRLKEELKDVSKLSDEKYISEWEKLDMRMQEWWRKNTK